MAQRLASFFMRQDARFIADCARCAGLCCVAPAFDKGEDFALDKPARQPCPNLDDDFRCEIHDVLAQRGFRGCIAFDCHGAGQRVVQDVFGGRNWRDNPAIASAMFDCFAVMRQLHEWLSLLQSAAALPLDAGQRQMLSALRERLGADRDWSVDDLLGFELAEPAQAVHDFLTSLQPLVGARDP